MASTQTKKRKNKNSFPQVDEDDLGFTDKGYVSELKASKPVDERQLQAELLNRFDQTAVIDAFEEAHGTRKQKTAEAPKYKFNNVILEPCKLKDQEMLNKLLNETDKYTIKLFKDTFSARTGDYKVFIIYGERIDETKALPAPTEKKDE
jgi:hypothetical protein